MKDLINNAEAIKYLESNRIAELIDNTLLRPDATENEIRDFVIESLNYNFSSICINPCWISFVKNLVNNKMRLTTVIGFPLGANSSQIKVIEVVNAVLNGVSEIDMVMNIGFLKSKRYSDIEKEIKDIRILCYGRILKVIIETCLLTKEEILTASKIVEQTGADFVKTSTGFSKHGANIEDIELIRNSVNIGIKASGGIKDLETLKKMIYAGATRIGTSEGIKIIKEFKKE